MAEETLVETPGSGDEDGRPEALGGPEGPEGSSGAPVEDEAIAGDASGAPTQGPIARLHGVERRYGDIVALGPLDLVLDGECVALLGPNGAGKSTLLRLLMGLLRPHAGTLEVLGRDVGHDTRRRIGYFPEGEALFPHLDGVQAVAYAGRLVGMEPGDALQRAHQVLDYVGLREARYRNASTYSTGMRQRLKLAQALVHDPELLVLDEPTEGVDPQARTQILELIDELRRTHGLRILVSTHLLADVERLATHAVVLSEGRVVLHGALDEIQRSGARGIAVRVAGDPAPLRAALDAAGMAWRDAHPETHVDAEDPSRILRIVQDAGLQVRHLAPVRLRLDDAFAQVLGRSMPEGGAVVA